MSNIIQFPNKVQESETSIGDEFVDLFEHSNPEVLKLWKEKAKAILEKYPDSPGAAALQLEIPAQLNEEEIESISVSINAYRELCEKGTRKVMLTMLSEIFVLQRELAELEVAASKQKN